MTRARRTLLAGCTALALAACNGAGNEQANEAALPDLNAMEELPPLNALEVEGGPAAPATPSPAEATPTAAPEPAAREPAARPARTKAPATPEPPPPPPPARNEMDHSEHNAH